MQETTTARVTHISPPDTVRAEDWEQEAPYETWWIAWGLCKDHAHTWTGKQIREVLGVLEAELERRKRNRRWLLERIRRVALGLDGRPPAFAGARPDKWVP